jgi:O-antigen/teichoic acid export membrane protein
MIVVIAKIGTPEMVGRFALAFAVTAPFVMFSNLNLRMVQATDARDEYSFVDYLTLRAIMQCVAFCIITGVALIFYHSTEVRIIILVIALAKIFESISDIHFGLFQKHERMDSISISLFLKGVLSIVGLTVGLYATNNILWGATGVASGWLLVLVLYDIPRAREILDVHQLPACPSNQLLNRFDKSVIKSLFLLSLPLGVTALLSSLMNNIPRYFIEKMLGERLLGIFAAIFYLVFIGNRVVTALGDSASPRLAIYFSLNEFKAYRKLIAKMLLVGLLIGIAGISVAATAGKGLLSILYKPDYTEYSNVFTWLMIVAGIIYLVLFFEYGMNSIHNFRMQPYILSISLVAMTTLCYLLIPRYGLLGAAIAMAMGYAIQLICYWKIISKSISSK